MPGKHELRVRIDHLIDRWYSPVIHLVIKQRYLTCGLSHRRVPYHPGDILSVAASTSPFARQSKPPFVQAEIEMPSGTPTERTREVAFLIEEAARKAIDKLGEEDILIAHHHFRC